MFTNQIGSYKNLFCMNQSEYFKLTTSKLAKATLGAKLETLYDTSRKIKSAKLKSEILITKTTAVLQYWTKT